MLVMQQSYWQNDASGQWALSSSLLATFVLFLVYIPIYLDAIVVIYYKSNYMRDFYFLFMLSILYWSL